MVAADALELPESVHHPAGRPLDFQTLVIAAAVLTELAILTELTAEPARCPCLKDLPSDRQASVGQLAVVVEPQPALLQVPASS